MPRDRRAATAGVALCRGAFLFPLRSLGALQHSTPCLVFYSTSTAGRSHVRSYGSLSLGMSPAYHRAKAIGCYLCASSTAVFSAPAPLTPPSCPLSRTPPCQVSTADSSPKPIVDNSNQEPLRPPWEGFEFPRLVGFLGDEECSLDALLESEPEQSVSEQGLIEQEEAWRLLCSWCVRAKVTLVCGFPPTFFALLSSRGYALNMSGDGRLGV